MTTSMANMLTGEMIRGQIVETLQSKNLSAHPAIDRARRFPDCSKPISIKSIFGSWKTVQISCPTSNWKIAVRTNINKSSPFIRNMDLKSQNKPQHLITLNTSLDRGDIIKETHLARIPQTKNFGGGVFNKKTQLIGRTLKQALSVGTIVKARHLNPDWIILKDQVVDIEHQVGNITINAQGIAQEPGQIGQRILVKNFNSGKKVLCWVENDKKVTTNAKVY